MGVSGLRLHMAQSSTQVEKRAISVGFATLKQVGRRGDNWQNEQEMGETTGQKKCRTPGCLSQISPNEVFCPACTNRQQQAVLPQSPQPLIRRSLDKKKSHLMSSMDKGEFRGYSKNTISGRAERQGKRRAWGKSRKNQSKRTAARYKRAKIRGSGSGARPKMRRQLGAGGKRVSRDR